MNNFTLLISSDYAKDVTQEIKKAKQRIYSLTMVITDDESTKELVAATKQAARQVEANIVIDAFTYSELGGAFSLRKRQKKPSLAAIKMLNDFTAAGAKTHILGNQPKVNPFSGVTHIKWVVIDNFVYCFGGINLYKKGIKNTDYMFKIRDKELADILIGEQKKIVECDKHNVPYSGLEKKLPFGNILIDSGKRHSSVIYERACYLADQSKEIVFVSQYCPTGELANYLKTIPSKIYFNPPKIASSLNSKVLIKANMLKTGLRTMYQKGAYIHAKFIIFTLKNGKKVALTGSHNFAYGGVVLGTKEVALETTDEKIIRQLEDFLQNHII